MGVSSLAGPDIRHSFIPHTPCPIITPTNFIHPSFLTTDAVADWSLGQPAGCTVTQGRMAELNQATLFMWSILSAW
jgi:hypothetical protein